MISNAEKLRDAVALHRAATTDVARLATYLHMTAVVRDIKRGPSERKAGAS